MNWKKQAWFIFLRSLVVFLAFWLLMSCVLVKQNQKRMETIIEWRYLDNAGDLVPLNVKSVLENEKPTEEEIGHLTWLLIQGNMYGGSTLGSTRVYDKDGRELGRSPISIGYIVLNGAFPVDYYLLFDPVLSEEEQIELGNILRDEMEDTNGFVGEASGENNYPEGWPNKGLYGEVTGIIENDCIYPQTLTYYYSDRTVTLVDSDHEMFQGAQLTTLRFDYAEVISALDSPYCAAEDVLKLYRRANELIDETVEGRSWETAEGHFVSTMANITRGAKDGIAQLGEDFSTGVRMARCFVYSPRRLAVYGLEGTLSTTFLVMLVLAALFARNQIKTLKKERQFTRAVAHEIKTPAAVLRATAEALSEGTAPERQTEYLASMVEESDRLAFMVNELLDLSRLEGSAAALKRQAVDLTALTEASFEHLRPAMQRRALELRLNLQPVTVSGDPKRLEQAVSNLAVNALEHAQEGPVTVFLSIRGERAVLTVSNACSFVTGEQLRHIWKPFYKLDESRSGSGSGLGLAVVKNVVTLHGGACSAHTTGDRIEFRVELPMGAE